MIVQPFVENAILHGINNLTDRTGRIIISVSTKGQYLCIIVSDNGVGRAKAAEIKAGKHPGTRGTGMGIRMVSDRLDLLSGKTKKQYKFEIKDLDEGTEVEITIPLDL